MDNRDHLKHSAPQLGIVKKTNKTVDPGQLEIVEPVRTLQVSLPGSISSMGQGKHCSNWAWRPITSDKKSVWLLFFVSSEEGDKSDGPPHFNSFEGEFSFVPNSPQGEVSSSSSGELLTVSSDVIDDEVMTIELMKSSKARCVDDNSSGARSDAVTGMISTKGWVMVGEGSNVFELEDLELPED